MLSIQTNVNSLVAQQNLSVNTAFQSKTIAQLTSGYRINQSGDDAAGLAVANKFRSTVAELTQGVANGNDATAQLQIMDGGMSNISAILDRLKTLATQSASGTFTGNRSTVNSEFQNDLLEIDRQAQSIGLNTGGAFAKNLDVYLGTGSGSTSLANGVVTLGLAQSAVDSQSLGLRGMEAVNLTSGSLAGNNAGTDLGATSATSVQNIIANTTGVNANQQATAGYAALQFSGAGFSDAGKIGISVNLAGVTDVSTLVAAVNSAIQTAGNGTTAAATAFKNANIVATLHTDSAGGQQLAFSSGTAAFQVQAGDQMANALLGNVSVVGGVAKGAAVAGSTVTGVTTKDGNFASTDTVKLVVTGGGLASPITLQLNTGASGVSTSGAITDLKNQFSGNTALQAAGLSMSGSSTVGGTLSFSSALGQTFNVQVTGDAANLLGLGSFLADSMGNADYTKITAATAYNASTVTGNATSTGLAAGMEISLNGAQSVALSAIDLTTGAHAVAASVTSGASVTGAAPGNLPGTVDITAANQNLDISVTNNGVLTRQSFQLSTNTVATQGKAVSSGATGTAVVQSSYVADGYSTRRISAANLNNQFTVAVDGGPAQTLTLRDGVYATAQSFLDEINHAITNDNGGNLSGKVIASYADVGSLPAGIGTGALTLTSLHTAGVNSSVLVGAATTATSGAAASTITALSAGTTAVSAALHNNKFTVSIDGGADVTLTLADNAGYTASTLLTAVQNAIANVGSGNTNSSGSDLTSTLTAGFALDAAGVANGALTLKSVSTGAGSSVKVSDATYTTAAVKTSSATADGAGAITALTIDATNDKLTLAVDGGPSVTLTLAHATYNTNADGLIADLAAKIGGSALSGKVTASWAVGGALTLSSVSANGAASTVNVSVSGSADAGAYLGFAASTATGSSQTNGGRSSVGLTLGLNTVGNSAQANSGLAKLGLAAVSGIVQSGTADGPSTVANIAAQIQTALGQAAVVSVSNDYKISIASAVKGANSSVVVNTPATNSANATLHLDAASTPQVVSGQNSSIADIVDNLNAQFAASSTFQNAGLTAAATQADGTGTGNFVTIQSTNNTQFRLNSVGTPTAATAGAIASTVSNQGTWTPITVSTANHNNTFNVAVDGAGATAITVADNTYSTAASFLTAVQAAVATHGLTAGFDATTGVLTLTSASTGAASKLVTSSATYASQAIQTSTITGSGAGNDVIPAVVVDATHNAFTVKVDANAVATVTVANGSYTSAASLATAIHDALTTSSIGNITGTVDATIDATSHQLVLKSNSTGAAAQVIVGVAGANPVANLLGFTASTQNGSAAAVNTGLTNFGFAATTNSGHQAQVTEDTGFGVKGSSFTAGVPTSATSTMSVLDAFGISNSTAFTFSAMKYGSDKQALTFSATDNAGTLETKTITLQNSTAAGANRAGVSIDSAVAYINQQLQQLTSNPALQKIVAVKENVGGQEKINFVSSLSNFTVGVAATANADGLNGGVATQQTSVSNGSGANMAVDTQAGAKAAVSAIVSAVSALGAAQAAVGKGQNQLTYAVNLAQSQITNFSAAESQIRDANVAQQAANLSKAQVLSQASIAAMAQANSAPQAVLSLLRG